MSRAKLGSLAGAVHGAATEGKHTARRKGPAPSRAGLRGVVTYLDPDVARNLKIIAAQLDSSMHDLTAAALEQLVDEHRHLLPAKIHNRRPPR